MTGERSEAGCSNGLRRASATIRVAVDDPETVTAAVRPDDTPEMSTRVEDDSAVTTVERDAIGGLRTTIDDVIVNLTVATKTAQLSDRKTQHENNE